MRYRARVLRVSVQKNQNLRGKFQNLKTAQTLLLVVDTELFIAVSVVHLSNGVLFR